MNKMLLATICYVLLVSIPEESIASKIGAHASSGKSTHDLGASVNVSASPVKVFCTNKTLKGTYSYSATGWRDQVQFAESGMETYDGNGNIYGIGSDSSSLENQSFTGKYLVNPDCTGYVDYGEGNTYNIYLAPDGTAYNYLDKSSQGQLSGVERRISTKFIIKP
jgi:hypothetical protein